MCKYSLYFSFKGRSLSCEILGLFIAFLRDPDLRMVDYQFYSCNLYARIPPLPDSPFKNMSSKTHNSLVKGF